jgi:hypothetical protein
MMNFINELDDSNASIISRDTNPKRLFGKKGNMSFSAGKVRKTLGPRVMSPRERD